MENEIFIIAGVIAFMVFVCGMLFAFTSGDKSTTSDKSDASEGTISDNRQQDTHKPSIPTLSDEELQARHSQRSIIEYELPIRKETLIANVQKISTTNNLFSLLGHYNEALECCKILEFDIKNGCPIKFLINDDDDRILILNKFCNENILRIALITCRTALEKCWDAKTLKGRQNKLSACFHDIERCKTELKDNPHKTDFISILDDLYHQVEDNISNLFQNEPLNPFVCAGMQDYERYIMVPDIEIEPISKYDSLFSEIAMFIVRYRQASISAIQRQFKIGYNRASQIIDQLEEAGIVGHLTNNTREVLIKDTDTLDKILDTLLY